MVGGQAQGLQASSVLPLGALVGLWGLVRQHTLWNPQPASHAALHFFAARKLGLVEHHADAVAVLSRPFDRTVTMQPARNVLS